MICKDCIHYVLRRVEVHSQPYPGMGGRYYDVWTCRLYFQGKMRLLCVDYQPWRDGIAFVDERSSPLRKEEV